jgi:predicted  nucleic acid-binding Zn-ribbon protein
MDYTIKELINNKRKRVENDDLTDREHKKKYTILVDDSEDYKELLNKFNILNNENQRLSKLSELNYKKLIDKAEEYENLLNRFGALSDKRQQLENQISALNDERQKLTSQLNKEERINIRIRDNIKELLSSPCPRTISYKWEKIINRK